VEGVEAGTQILAKDLDLPSGTTLQIDDDALVVNVTAAVEMELESESDAVEAAGEEPESGEETVSAVAGEPGEAGEENASA
jgi:large subunit ribosomal protein L25